MKLHFAQLKASLVTAACLLGLVAALRDLVGVPAQVIARDVVLYLILYWAIGLYPLPAPAGAPAAGNRLLGRSLLLVVVTLAIIAVYAWRQG